MRRSPLRTPSLRRKSPAARSRTGSPGLTVGRWLPFGVVALVAILALFPALFLDRIPAETDLHRKFGPWTTQIPDTLQEIGGGDSFFAYLPDRLVAVNQWKQGMLPLWNPYVAAGMPILGMQTANPLDPLIALQLVLPTGAALGLAYALLLALAGVGMILFLRGRGVREPAALALGGISFALSPYFVFWLESRVFLAGLAPLPLALWALDRAWRDGSGRGASILALCVGYSALAGTLQTLTLFLAVIGIRLLWIHRDRNRDAVAAPSSRLIPSPWLHTVLAIAAGLAIGVLPLVAGIEAFLNSIRTGGRAYYADSNFLPWRALALWFNPQLFGGFTGEAYVGKAVLHRTLAGSSGWGAPGIVTLGLAVYALLGRAGPRRERVFWGGLAGLVLCFLLAMRGPLHTLLRSLWESVDGIDLLRGLVIVNLGASILAAFGAEGMVRGWRDAPTARRWTLPWVIVLAAGAGFIAVARLGITAPHPVLVDLLPVLLTAAAMGAIGLAGRRAGGASGWRSWSLVLLVALELGHTHFRYNRFPPSGSEYPRHPVIDEVRVRLGAPDYSRFFAPGSVRVLPPNIASVYQLSDLRGYSNVSNARIRLLMEAAEGQAMLNRNIVTRVESPVYRLLGGGYAFFAQPPDVEPGLFLPVTIRGLKRGFYHRRDVLPRAFLVHDVRLVADESALRAAIADPAWDPARTVLLEASIGPAPAASPPAGPERVTIIALEPARVRIQVRASSPGVLILADAFYPGWRARVDGVPAPVLPADWAVRGVALGPGDHEVEFRYRPWWLVPGLFLTVVGLGAALALTLTPWPGSPTRPESRPR